MNILKSSLAKVISEQSENYNFSSDYGNELFLYDILPNIERRYLSQKISRRGVDSGFDGKRDDEKVKFRGLSSRIKPIAQYVLELLEWVLIFLVFVPLTLGFASCLALYLIAFRGSQKKLNVKKDLCVVRTPAAWEKLRRQPMLSDTMFMVDDLSLKSTRLPSLYCQPFCNRLSMFFKLPKLLWVDILELVKDSRLIDSLAQRQKIYKRMLFRLPHKVIYGAYLDEILKKCEIKKYVSGNKEDRFALLEKRLCNKYSIKTICIPHGLEYGFRLPCGIFGDSFYCNSNDAKLVLRNIYKEDLCEFIFDRKVAKYMFGYDDSRSKNFTTSSKIVFFPESREINVNRSILKELVELDEEIYLKLHPLDEFSNYSDIVEESCIINELDEALEGTICLARKSTVLLESLYRGGRPCALLFNQKDREYVKQIFPSLSNSDIVSAYNIDDLKKFLNLE